MRSLVLLALMACSTPIFGQSAEKNTAPPTSIQHAIRDVRLTSAPLVIRLLTPSGRPIANSPVEIRFSGKPICRVATNQSGLCQVHGLRAGVHTIQTSSGVKPIRFWHDDRAPANAVDSVAIVADSTIRHRGQFMVPPPGPSVGPLAFGTTITTAALIAAIIEKSDGSDSVVPSAAASSGSSVSTTSTSGTVTHNNPASP